MKLLTLLILLISSAPAHADVIVRSIQGYSRVRNFNPNATTNTSIQIFGGLGGDENDGGCSTGKDSVSTCNNCIGSEYKICNERRVYDTLKLQFTFASTKVQRGTPVVTMQNGNATDDIVPSNNPALTTDTNQLASVQVTWQQLIATMKAVGNAAAIADGCRTAPCTQTIRVGLDANGGGLLGSEDDAATMTLFVFDPNPVTLTIVNPTTCLAGSTGGICEYSLFPGDSKAYLENMKISQVPGGRPLAAAIFICTEGPEPIDFTAVNIPSYLPDLKRVTLNGVSPVEETIEGFSNQVRYYCRASVEDDTGNIMLFNERVTATQDTACPTPGYQGPAGECHTVKPDEVIGLFKEKQNCFIATAAFGTPWMAEVKTLRRFRSEFLAKFSLGRSFISWYKVNAPPIAGWIAETPERRLAARIVLMPLYFTAYAYVNWPLATLTLILGLVFLIGYRRFLRMRTR